MKKLAPLALLLALPVAAQELTALKTTDVVDGMYMVEGADGFAGGNITMLVGEDVFLIDDGIPPAGSMLIQLAEKLVGRSIDYVVNTHLHGDHVGGNAALADDGTLIFAHDNIRKRLLDDTSLSGGPGGLPTITFSDAVTFHVNGHEANVVHLAAAHTDGDAIIYFRDVNVIHAGDLFFNYLFPFIDLDNGGSVAGFKAGQQRIIDTADADTIIIPGHGPLATRADLQIALDVLTDSEARVQKLVAQGMSQAQVLEANPLADYHEQWNWGFITTERMTITLYRSLTDGQ
ncbi:MAG: MBL fold metallo-hydrolase [Proteobacteria bacterium]|nr:MBL fold metallo-hydrolase [Pseudomonadota bacterium]MDA1062867.1 MBL fold metallo-hydrolase [Pseudomonadota bacterium]